MQCPCCGGGMLEKSKTLPGNQRSILHDKIWVCVTCLLEGHEVQLKSSGPRAHLATEHQVRLQTMKIAGEKAALALEAITAFNGN